MGIIMKKNNLYRTLLSFLFLFGLISLFTVYNSESKVLAATYKQAGIANVDYSFTSTDGTTVNTKSNSGQTSIIIFGSTKCGNTQRTIKSIASSEWVNTSDIRVIFAECNKATLAETNAFAKSYGCNDITFCYEENYKNIYNAMWDYFDMFHDPTVANTGVGLPFTVLIDGNNQVQKVLTGYYSADAIMDEIKQFSSPDYVEKNPKLNVYIEGTENYSYANDVLSLVNQTRAQGGLPALKLDSELTEAAMQRAAEIALYYSHTRPDGTDCFTISNRATYKAENIAVGYLTPNSVMDGWISSEGHYKNIMSAYATSIGIGCFMDSEGTLNWVQFFDNAPANVPNLSGNKKVTRTVSMQKSFFHLQGNNDLAFNYSDINKTIKMAIYNMNDTWNYSKPELTAGNFNFKSSNDAVATVNDNGIITLKSSGEATITASLKTDDTLSVKQKITVNQADTPSTQPPVSGDDTIKIPNVTGFKSSSTENNIKLYWNKVTNATGYLLYQYNNSGKKWETIATTKSDSLSFTVKKLKSGTNYRFAVKAYVVKDGKQVTNAGYTSLYTTTNPEKVKFTLKAGKKKAALKWKKVSGATGYIVYYKTSEKGSWKKLKTTKGTVYTKKKLKSGKKYFFTVKAYKTYKGKKYNGNYIIKTAKIK